MGAELLHRADMHVHYFDPKYGSDQCRISPVGDLSKEEYTSEGVTATPEEIFERAVYMGLHTLSLVQHNLLRPESIDDLTIRADRYHIRYFSGIELSGIVRITTVGEYQTWTPHTLINNVTAEEAEKLNSLAYKDLDTIFAELSLLKSKSRIIVTAPHPFENNSISLCRAQIKEYQSVLDAIEVTTYMYDYPEYKKLGEELKLAIIAGNDVHIIEQLGWVYTTYPESMSVLQAIRQRKTSAVRISDPLWLPRIGLSVAEWYTRMNIETNFQTTAG